MTHLARPALAARFPVLVTWRLASGVPDVRVRRLFSVVLRALSGARVREATGRVVHFSVQSNHIHLIAEARDAPALSRFLQGVAIRVARGLNGRLGRSGRVFGDRFHSRILRTPLEVHRAIRYVLVNARKHAAQRRAPFPAAWMDGCSSAAWFDGWAAPYAAERAIGLAHGQVRGSSGIAIAPVSAPRTWLLEIGWRLHGLLDADATPPL